MRIVVDAMGGDNAPKAAVAGALRALNDGIEITLVGQGERILECLKDEGCSEIPKGLEITHASDIIDGEEDPTSAVRHKTDSSLVVGLKLVADGQADGFVGAGSTGALLTGATLIVKRIKGIRRAAIASVLPVNGGKTLILDCGANTECTPEYLLQFAYMGAYYLQNVLGVENPSVGLLNNGTESHKGAPLQKEAYQLLKEASENGKLNFVGNVEAREVLNQAANVIVADGFSGNVLLKSIEGTAGFMVKMLKEMFLGSKKSKMAALMVKSDLKEMKSMLDYRTVGGSPFIGIQKPVIKAHGSSDALAFENAIKQAAKFAKSGAIEMITANIADMKLNGTAIDK